MAELVRADTHHPKGEGIAGGDGRGQTQPHPAEREGDVIAKRGVIVEEGEAVAQAQIGQPAGENVARGDGSLEGGNPIKVEQAIPLPRHMAAQEGLDGQQRQKKNAERGMGNAE